jgi:hypothetical protein
MMTVEGGEPLFFSAPIVRRKEFFLWNANNPKILIDVPVHICLAAIEACAAIVLLSIFDKNSFPDAAFRRKQNALTTVPLKILRKPGN